MAAHPDDIHAERMRAGALRGGDVPLTITLHGMEGVQPIRRRAVSCLFDGRVIHRRFTGPDHAVDYRVHTLWLDLAEAPVLARRLRLFSYNRAGVFSFRERDHGPRDGTPARVWVAERLAQEGVDLEGGPIRVLCYPRTLGYVFNPLSIWFGYGPDGRLRGIVYEVANTFGGWHTYVAPVDAVSAARGVVRHAADKAFHVSPFFDKQGGYEFRTAVPRDSLNAVIRYSAGGQRRMTAVYTGTRVPLSDRALAAALWRTGHLTAKVTAGIHWEALKLWRKGARFHRDPADPNGRSTPASPSGGTRDQSDVRLRDPA